MSLDDNIKIMSDIFNEHRKCNISGVELNLSCPNIIGNHRLVTILLLSKRL